MATERGTSDKTEATRFSQCAHDQRRRLEAENCDSIRCAQLISGGRRRIRPPHCLAHACPTMCCVCLVIFRCPSKVYMSHVHMYIPLYLLTGLNRGHGILAWCMRYTTVPRVCFCNTTGESLTCIVQAKWLSTVHVLVAVALSASSALDFNFVV